jgi:FtsP/CotA-like multicopper oxidase with cupredoxin domain
MTDFTRREVLHLGGLALGSALVGSSMLGCDLLFLDPPLLPLVRPEPGLAVAELRAAAAKVSVAERPTRVLAYGGCFPGPVIRVRAGETLRLGFTNDLAAETNLHFHGLHVDPGVDDPFLHVHPGERHVYELAIPWEARGTYWYHPHVHGRVAVQLFAGLAGAIVVDPPEEIPGLAAADDHVLVLKDITLANGAVASHTAMDWRTGKRGALSLVNGRLARVLSTTAGLLRLRLLNANNARFYRLRLEGLPMLQIASDGGLLERPVERSEIALAPGERAELLVPVIHSGLFWLRDFGCGASSGMGFPEPGACGPDGAEDLLLLAASGATAPPEVPDRLVTVPRLDPAAARERPVLTLADGMMGSGGMGGGMMGGGRMMGGFTINGRAFDPDRTDVRGTLGATALWQVTNAGMMHHPFHLHTYSFQVVDRNGVPEPVRAWKDTVDLAPGDTVRLVVRYGDFGGRTVFHCHIPEHEDQGMMGVLEV